MNKFTSSILIFLSVITILFSGCQSEQHPSPLPYAEINQIQIDKPQQIEVMDYDINNDNPVQKDSIYINYNRKPLNLTLPLYVHAGRYFLPLKDTLAYIDSNIDVDLTNKRCLKLGDIDYISLFDLTKMLGLIVDWNTKSKTVSLYTGDTPVMPAVKPVKGKPALVRLEDITAFGDAIADPNELVYFKAIADYFYSNAIPFSVAWVPRYVNPDRNIDNDLAATYSIYNISFVFTLDYFIDRGGIIGLHGYTHQFGKKASIADIEFGPGVNENDSSTRKRINMAISSAKALEIPIGFFEFAHYSATKRQFLIAEEYFDYIYQHPYNRWVNKVVSHQNNGRLVKYISTPLEYLNSKKNVSPFLESINSLGDSSIASFFFHPHLDYEFIKVSRDTSGRPSYYYAKDSLLHQIVDTIRKKGYTFVSPSEL